MDQENLQILKEQIAKLPPEVQDAVISPSLRIKLTDIGKKYALHIDQIGKLEDETVLVMIGLADPADFIVNLSKRVDLEKSVADKVGADISEQIFLPIRESMKKFMEEEGRREEPPSTPQNPPAATRDVPVLMPSASMSSATPTPKPTAPITVSSTPAKTPPPTPPTHAANVMLAETTISMSKKVESAVPVAPVSPAQTAPAKNIAVPKLGPYKADPYREPPE